MQILPPTPANDAQIHAALTDPARLAAVRDIRLLDTPAEAVFDRMTQLAAKLTGAPVTFVSLVDADRDFYKSAYGLGEPLKTTRELMGRTFCHYAVVSGEPVVIEDATQLPVFKDVPTVNSLGVRAYAGIPLKTATGEVLGSFCAVDFQAKKWTPLQIEVLSELAEASMREIRLRQALQEAESLNKQLLAQVQRVDELNRALTELATTDPLTGLNNRRAFDDGLDRELATVGRRHTPLSLLVLDIDHFKKVNDTFGHNLGDRVLMAVAQVLNDCARVTDLVARVGGEEFALVLPHTNSEGACGVAERIRLAVAQAHWLDDMPITVSIGVATLQGSEDAAGFFSRADAALYAAKAAGRNCVTRAD